MAIISVGYTGDIDETAWAQTTAHMSGSPYGVRGINDWRVGRGSADRELRITPGVGYGAGIIDELTEETRLALPAPATGVVWHLIVARRSWQNNETTFVSIPGDAQPRLPNRATTIGEVDEQPLALAMVEAGKTQVIEMIDLRVWKGPGGATAQHRLVLDYMSSLGTQIAIGASQWARIVSPVGEPVWSDLNAGRLLSVFDVPIFDLPPSGALPNQGITVWGNQTQLIAGIDFPDPGVPYRIQMSGQGFWGNEMQGQGTRHDIDFTVGGQPFATWMPPSDDFWFGNWRSWTPPITREVFTGASSVHVRVRRIYGNPYGAIRKSESLFRAALFSA